MNSLHETHSPSLTRTPARLASCLFVLVLAAGAAKADAVAVQVSGQVEIGRGEPPQWTALRKGDSISADERVRTGADGRIEIKMDAGTLRVHENSMLRLPPAREDSDQVELEQGHSLFDVLRRAGRRFEVHTPTVVVSVKGTRFGVDASADVGQVAVYRGLVGVREVGMEVALETLVREGFLATGGSGVPIELDLAPKGDPWASWQDFQRQTIERNQAPARLGDMDRAKQTLHRATNADVLRKAAERRPEVAERLRRMQAEQIQPTDSTDEKREVRPDAEPAPTFPAAPDLSGEDASKASKRETMQKLMRNDGDAMERQSKRKQLRARDQMLETLRAEEKLRESVMPEMPTAGSSNDPASGIGPWQEIDLNEFDEIPLPLLSTVMSSLEDVHDQWESSTTAWTQDDLRSNFENAMLSNGMPPDLARDIAQNLVE